VVQPSTERRVWARKASNRQTICLSDNETDEIIWVARIQDICRQGIRLLARRRFGPGTMLRFEVSANPRETPLLLLAQVIHATDCPDGNYVLGCAFSRLLTDQELAELGF